MQVLFNGKSGTINSISPTEIKATVPVTTSGNVSIAINGINVNGPAFTYTSPTSSPYISGNVVLSSQAEVDGFVSQNKGKTLQITGSLTVSGNDITSTSGLSNITSVAQNLTVSGNMLNDVTFLKTLTSVGGNILLSNLGAEKISMDNLVGTVSAVTVSSCKNLRNLSLKSLSSITGSIYTGGLLISNSAQLSDIDLSSLTMITYKLSIIGSAMRDFSKFSSLQSAGSMTITSNTSLTSFKGLERLTALTLKPSSPSYSSSSVLQGGLTVTGNTNLHSLDGLQNLKDVAIARVSQNPALTDLCPSKDMFLTLSTAASYVYYRRTQYEITYTKVTVPALSLAANGGLTLTSDAIKALSLCK